MSKGKNRRGESDPGVSYQMKWGEQHRPEQNSGCVCGNVWIDFLFLLVKGGVRWGSENRPLEPQCSIKSSDSLSLCHRQTLND